MASKRTADKMENKEKDKAETSTTDAKKQERLNKLAQLRLRQNEARKLNHKEVIEEDRKAKLPGNWEKQKERMDYEEEKEKRKKEIEEKGLEYERVRALEWTAEECEIWERKRAKKHNPDTGFADFEQSSHRQYERLTKQIQPDMDNYEKQKEELGEDFYADTKSLIYGTHKPSKQAVDKMVEDLEKQMDKRKGYSRKRSEKAVDVDFINERNMRFNSKIERAYGKYTTEIKQNLERGTAI